ncbi:MAG TPA: c-type cytochrome [Anaerolineaceae bacterium]
MHWLAVIGASHMTNNMIYRVIAFFLAAGSLFSAAACSNNVNGVPEPKSVTRESIESGRVFMANYGCGSCHTIPGVPGADSKAGPPLDRFFERMYIAGRIDNTADNLIQWIMNPQEIDPGNAMPDLGVTEDEARSMAAYLYHKPTILDWFQR